MTEYTNEAETPRRGDTARVPRELVEDETPVYGDF